MKVRDYPDWIAEILYERGYEPLDMIDGNKAMDEWLEWEGIIGYGATIRDLYRSTRE